MPTTHTYVTLPVSRATYDEVTKLLRAAEYDHCFEDGEIDMHGLALVLADGGPAGNTLEELRPLSMQRCIESFHHFMSWSPTDWSNAMAGEAGETCNLTKKMLRGDDIPLQSVAYEIADVIIYADLLAARLGIDLCAAIREKFNIVSDRVGSPIKMLD